MAEWLWINGDVQPIDQPALSGLDRGFLLGEGVYETLVFRNGQLWKPRLHARRMAEGLAGLSIPLQVGEADLHGILDDLQRREGLEEGILRVTASSGAGGRGLVADTAGNPVLTAFISALPTGHQPPLSAVISTIRRNAHSPACRWKVIPGIDQILARREALAQGADEALMCSTEGELSCFASGNILLWDGSRFLTPRPESGALPGTTLALLRERLPITDARIMPKDLHRAQGAWLLNTLRGALPVMRIDSIALASPDLESSRQLREGLGAQSKES
jgi:branched-chain amino acid aminotransferase